MGDFNNWLGEQIFDEKIVIAGNHDAFIEADEKIAERLLSNAIYLSDELVTVNGLRIYGSPWTSFFNPQRLAFTMNAGGGELARRRALIPDRLDILITHAAPYRILDGEHKYGEKLLKARLLGMKPSPKLCVFGHVHEGYGIRRGAKDEAGTRTTYVNAALCNNSNKLVNQPITVEI